MKKIVLSLMAVFSLTCGTQAVPVAVELALCIDNSGSIGTANFNLQINGYVQALTALLPTDGSVAIGVWAFETTDHLIFNERVIASSADKTALINAIAGIGYIGGLTALGASITDAYTRLIQSDIVGAKKIIDVSTDGFGNTGINQVTARNNALAAGIDQINGLLVGTGATSTFVGGTGSFYYTISGFSTFEAAIRKKLANELSVPDAASTWALMGLALVGLAGFRRIFAPSPAV